jgi:hypothetical protein
LGAAPGKLNACNLNPVHCSCQVENFKECQKDLKAAVESLEDAISPLKSKK